MLNAPTLLRCIVIDSGIAIFSAGDLAIGGSLDASHRATGQADTVNNISAGIEALGVCAHSILTTCAR